MSADVRTRAQAAYREAVDAATRDRHEAGRRSMLAARQLVRDVLGDVGLELDMHPNGAQPGEYLTSLEGLTLLAVPALDDPGYASLYLIAVDGMRLPQGPEAFDSLPALGLLLDRYRPAERPAPQRAGT